MKLAELVREIGIVVGRVIEAGLTPEDIEVGLSIQLEGGRKIDSTIPQLRGKKLIIKDCCIIETTGKNDKV